MTTGKTIALTIQTFISKVMSLLFNTLSRFVIDFLPKSNHLLISWLQSPSTVILETTKRKSVTASTFSLYLPWSDLDALVLCVLVSCVQLFATPWNVAHQVPLSMEFSRQEYWSGLAFPSPGHLPNTGIEPGTHESQADSLSSEQPGKPMILVFIILSFKPGFSLSSSTLIKRLFSSSLLSAIRVVSSAYLRLLIHSLTMQALFKIL